MAVTMVRFTKQIPICPQCQEGTSRIFVFAGAHNHMGVPEYNKEGRLVDPDGAITKREYRCRDCGTNYAIIGSNEMGFIYD